MKSFLTFVLLLAAVVGGGYYYYTHYYNVRTTSYRTTQVERGEISPTIEATGTVEPEQVVDIGSQVNGLVTELKVDYGSNVAKDEVLALIDPTIYQAAVDQAQAQAESAKANLLQAKANLNLAQKNLARDAEMIKKGAIAPSQWDADSASVEVDKAIIGVDKAAINQSEATLRQAQINLGYCQIKSPVKGTIVDRRVNVGQTVVSSLSASSLFLLAQDLSRIQVWASVNEADIGRIREGVKVHFTVDAYPSETFLGVVSQIRLNATMTQNVVTYTVVVTTDNKDLRLLPYMTASLKFEIEHHDNVLKVANAALRWKPRPKQIAPEIRAETLAAMAKHDEKAKGAGGKPRAEKSSGQKAAAASSADSMLVASAGTAAVLSPEAFKARTEKNARKTGNEPPKEGPKATVGGRQPPGIPVTLPAPKPAEHHEHARLWVADGAFVRPVLVRVGASDGTMTEVDGKDLSEGMDVVIGESVAAEADDDTTNPFLPKFPGKNKNNTKDSGSAK